MRAGTNEWQRIDNTGCLPWIFRAMLLSWAVVLPYAVITGSKEWFGWSLACVLAGVWLTLRGRANRFVAPEMTVDVVPAELQAGEQFLVTLNIGGDKARTIRWWSAEMMVEVAGDDPKSLVTAEFAIDPEAETSPIAELQMVLTVPDATAMRAFNSQDLFVQVTVQTERGRMESGKVAVQVH